MSKANKKHHYIPQCYLKNFSYNAKKLHSYDKVSSRIYAQNIDCACEITDFYKLSEGYIKENPIDKGKELIIECEYFADNIEPAYNRIINALINIKDRCIVENKSGKIGLDTINKFDIAKFIIIQYFRLPTFRSTLESIAKYPLQQVGAIFNELVSQIEKDPEIADANFSIKFDPALMHAQYSFMNIEIVEEFASVLANNYWSFLVSENGNFYTSDNPFAIVQHSTSVEPVKYLGLGQYGVEVTFPISKNIVLAIWDKEYFANKKDSDCVFTLVGAKEENKQNCQRYFNAKRHVFSFHNEFKLVDHIKADEGGELVSNSSF